MAERRVLTVAVVLGLAGSALGVEPAVRRLAGSSETGDRRRAAEALADEGTVAAVKLLRTLIGDEHPWVRDWAVNSCQRLRDPDAIGALVPLTKHRDVLARRNGGRMVTY